MTVKFILRTQIRAKSCRHFEYNFKKIETLWNKRNNVKVGAVDTIRINLLFL